MFNQSLLSLNHYLSFYLKSFYGSFRTECGAVYRKKWFLHSKNANQKYNHPYHLVSVSPWPLFVSFSLLSVTVGFVLYFHQLSSIFSMLFGLGTLILVMIYWFSDVVREGTFEGNHTSFVQVGLKLGMLLFILSEIMFFFSFFWGFFHSSLVPAIQIGGVWPPAGVSVFNPWDVPLLNTLILLTSGVTVTWAHYAIRSRLFRKLENKFTEVLSRSFSKYNIILLRWANLFSCHGATAFRLSQQQSVYNKLCVYFEHTAYLGLLWERKLQFSLKAENLIKLFFFFCWKKRLAYVTSLFNNLFFSSRVDFLVALALTVLLGALFTKIQHYEYVNAMFSISDSIYGSTFFLTTGFHGLHVLVGTVLLVVCFFRGFFYHFTTTHHVGLESSIWYWHFVDVVWLGLYLSIYHWGS